MRLIPFIRTQFRRVSRFFARMRPGKPRDKPDQIPSHLNAQVSGQPGLTCPRCREKFPISIPMLLSGQPIFCPHCLLRLDVDKAKSEQSLKALGKLQCDLDRANEILNR